MEYIIGGLEDRDPHIISLLYSRQLWFVLVVNPDGYYYNEQHIKNAKVGYDGQRKNRQKSTCNDDKLLGVDLNRNYDVCFNEDDIGSSNYPCQEVFIL